MYQLNRNSRVLGEECVFTRLVRNAANILDMTDWELYQVMKGNMK